MPWNRPVIPAGTYDPGRFSGILLPVLFMYNLRSVLQKEKKKKYCLAWYCLILFFGKSITYTFFGKKVWRYTFLEKSMTVYLFWKKVWRYTFLFEKVSQDTFFQKSITVYLFLKKYTFFNGCSLRRVFPSRDTRTPVLGQFVGDRQPCWDIWSFPKAHALWHLAAALRLFGRWVSQCYRLL